MPGHVPVMVGEVLEALSPAPGGRILDATVGFGGHASAILTSSAPDGALVGLDRDPAALVRAQGALAPFAGRFVLRRGAFGALAALFDGEGPFDGILLDLGVNSAQLADPARGFSFTHDGPLDMRMDPGQELTAEAILNRWPEEDLARILFEYGEERRSRVLARRIVAARKRKPLKRTGQLADICTGAVMRRARIHPATRVFQALRIAVNAELENLEAALDAIPGLLGDGGRVVVISFHSLEDRRVKQAFRKEASAGRLEILTPKPRTPGEGERRDNPRSRSAKLRAAKRI